MRQMQEHYQLLINFILIIGGLIICKSYPMNYEDDKRDFIFQIGTKNHNGFPKSSVERNSGRCPIPHTYGDCGRGESCGKGNSTPVEIWWYPKIIDPRSSLTVSLDYKLPMSVANATAFLDVYTFHSYKPLFTIIQEATCEQLQQALAEYHIIISCPLQEGFPVKIKWPVERLKHLPTGNFTIVMALENEEHKTFLCVKGSFEIRRN